MNKSVNIDQLRSEISYDPDTGMFTWLKRGRGRSLGAFIGTPVIKTYRMFKHSHDPATGAYLGLVPAPDKLEHRGYIIRVLGATYPAHTLAYALQTGKWVRVSHLNGDLEDNRFINLSSDKDKVRLFKERNEAAIQQKAQELLSLRDSAKHAASEAEQEVVTLISTLYQYNPEEGLFMRLGTKYQNWDKGTPVKSNNSRSLYFKDPITKASRSCPCHIAAFILQTGTYPEGKMGHHNGDKNDNRWENLYVR
jgi:hypothetical protein